MVLRIASAVRSVKSPSLNRFKLGDSPKPVKISTVRKLIETADYIALAVSMGGLRQEVIDISRRMARKVLARMARRFVKVPVAMVLGTLVIGDSPNV